MMDILKIFSKEESEHLVNYCARCGLEKPETKDSPYENMVCCYECKSELLTEHAEYLEKQKSFYENRTIELEKETSDLRKKVAKYEDMFGAFDASVV